MDFTLVFYGYGVAVYLFTSIILRIVLGKPPKIMEGETGSVGLEVSKIEFYIERNLQ